MGELRLLDGSSGDAPGGPRGFDEVPSGPDSAIPPSYDYSKLHLSDNGLRAEGDAQHLRLYWQNLALNAFRFPGILISGTAMSAKEELLDRAGEYHDVIITGGIGGFHLIPDSKAASPHFSQIFSGRANGVRVA